MLRGCLVFEWLLLKTAWGNFVAFGRRHIPGMVLTLVCSAVALPLVRFLGADPMQEAGLTILYSLVGPTVILCIIFLYFNLRAPADVYYQKKKENEELRQRLGETKQDFREWADLDPIELGQAAFLWSGQSPHEDPQSNPKASVAYFKISRSIENEEIQPSLGERGRSFWEVSKLFRDLEGGLRDRINPKLRVSYSELRKLAIKWGERPIFLFPDDVNPPKEIRRDMSIREMLEYVGVTTELDRENIDRAYAVLERFRQLAYEGHLKVWGRPDSVNTHPQRRYRVIKEIPKAEWEYNIDIDGLRAIKERDWRNICTEARRSNTVPTLFTDLYVSRAQIAKNLKQLTPLPNELTDNQSQQDIE